MTIFWSPDRKTFGLQIGVSSGIGGFGAVGVSDTKVRTYGGLTGWLLKLIWNGLNPGFSVPQLLSSAYRLIISHLGGESAC